MRKKVDTLLKEAIEELKSSSSRKLDIISTLNIALANYKIENCLSCKGTGKCQRCHGRGIATSCAFDNQPQFEHKCYVCRGTGICSECKIGRIK